MTGLHAVRNDVRLRDAFHRRRARLAHHHLRLLAQEGEHRLHSFLAERRESPDVWPSNPRRRRAERERLEDVGAAANAAVDDYRNTAAHALDYFRQTRNRRSRAVLGASAMV